VARTGRRPGNPDTREAILAAAREAFADRGFDGASIRAIATAAGVDPALVHHYFGTKDQLFLEAMRVPVDPGSVLTEVLSGGRDGVGERVVRVLLTVWDSPVGVGAAAILRSAMSNEVFSRMFREFVTHMILRRVAKVLQLDPAEAGLRTGLVATQMAGLIVARYLLRIEPLASAPVETLVAQIGPTVQRYLTEPLSPPAARTTIPPAAPPARMRKNQPGERP
jgi:AcrR family transcriptional regulator